MIKRARSFTLIELIAVIAIILILAGIVAPRLDISLKSHRLDADTKKLASNLVLAQNYAMGQKNGYRYYGIHFDTQSYRVGYYTTTGGVFNVIVVPNSVDVAGKIPFSEGISRSSGPLDIIFQFDGSTQAVYPSIVLTNGYSIKEITVTRLTGYINIT